MVLKIDRDTSRFRQIVKGRIRKELRKYLTSSELIGRQGKHFVSIPLPQIEIPHFCYRQEDAGGVGQGEGSPGTPIATGEPESGSGGAGSLPGEHLTEVEVSLEELAEILGEELDLPRIVSRGKKNIVSEAERYTGIRRAGPESLRHFRRTYRSALRRQIISGAYDLESPVIIPVREDWRYRARKEVLLPENTAVIIYMMDVSGSMAGEQKEIVRIEAFWIDTWIRSHYRGIDSRYLIHDSEAHEVDQETFYHTKEGGGTIISSAYLLCHEIIESQYPPSDWNIYLFHFSDGDNHSSDDNQLCVKILEEKLLPKANLFGYAQVLSKHGGGSFFDDLESHLGEHEAVALSKIESRDGIIDSIGDFFKKGR